MVDSKLSMMDQAELLTDTDAEEEFMLEQQQSVDSEGEKEEETIEAYLGAELYNKRMFP